MNDKLDDIEKTGREMFPDTWELYDTVGFRPVEYGFGWIIYGKSGTYGLEEVFAHINSYIKGIKK